MLKTNNGWIDVNDKLPPPKNGNILVLLESKKINIGFYCDENNKFFYSQSHTFVDYNNILNSEQYNLFYTIIKDVTHWMPLPEFPNNKDI